MNSEPNLYWSQMGTRVRENRRKTVRDHILLGDHFFGHFPLAIPPGGLARHLQTFGGSGFGKTVVASQLTEQVMDAGEASIPRGADTSTTTGKRPSAKARARSDLRRVSTACWNSHRLG